MTTVAQTQLQDLLAASFVERIWLLIQEEMDKYEYETNFKIQSPDDAARLLMPEMMNLKQEVMRVVLLDTKNNVMAVRTLYKGSLNASVVRVAEVFRDAIRVNAAAILIAHNHPSGDPTPSPEDVRVTHSIVEAGRLLDIKVLDHLIIGRNRWVSLRERGLGGFDF